MEAEDWLLVQDDLETTAEPIEAAPSVLSGGALLDACKTKFWAQVASLDLPQFSIAALHDQLQTAVKLTTEEAERFVASVVTTFDIGGDDEDGGDDTALAEFVHKLETSHIRRFDGTRFARWFATAEPVFEEMLVPGSYLRGVKLYSEPRTAALMSDLAGPWDQCFRELKMRFP